MFNIYASNTVYTVIFADFMFKCFQEMEDYVLLFHTRPDLVAFIRSNLNYFVKLKLKYSLFPTKFKHFTVIFR